jgi:two-component sensor histidine kinase
MRLRWQERGGPPVTPPASDGFGSRLISRIFEGGVDFAFERAGLVCTLETPL